jgi:hypothetical protein
VTWRVDPDDHQVWLYPDNSDEPYRLDPGEAWDLGDDLIIAADQLLPWQSVGFTTMPPWQEHIQLTIAWSNRLALVCDDHGVIHYLGMQMPLSEATGLARAHWAQQHSAEVDVAEDAEGEDRDAQADPAVPEAKSQAEAVADAHGGGDQVQQDLQDSHRPVPPPGGIIV